MGRTLDKFGRQSSLEKDLCGQTIWYTKKIFVARPYGTRKRGRPRLRWIDCLEKDLKTSNIINWKSQAKNRVA
ncbi:hypothetical protein TNCV_3681531 [Trichonephila clavipes]|uniref:Uncharacterized protein n=1 Tax=Trichonephila clavipes TaxID=2585209 RepID=A0A8X6RFF2_TRICX|nr:hypothetical protein TNCV_3681531 [Trichonephila clavipes]